MSYLSIQDQLEAARIAHARAVIEAVKHRVSLSHTLRDDDSGDGIYDLFNDLYDREAGMFADFAKQDGYLMLVEAFPQCDGPSPRDLEQTPGVGE